MSTTRSLQSCLESLLLEPCDLMHQLLPSKSLLSFQCPPNHHTKEKEREKGHHSLSKPNTSLTRKNGEEAAYVHPLSSKASLLSSKSLEMCTESLGCETGSGIDQLSLLATTAVAGEEEEEEEVQSKIEQPRRQQAMIKKAKQGGGSLKFPPPLSSISGGSGGVEVQTHREGGRLVIKAVSLSKSCSFFQAERGNGRLRLSLMKEGEEEEEVGDGEAEIDGEEGFEGPFWGEKNLKEEGGKIWSSSSSSRCNGERSSSRKRLQSLPFCVVGV